MTPTLLAVIAIVVGALVGAAIGYFLSARAMAQRGELSEKKAEALLKDTQDRADKRASDLLAEARVLHLAESRTTKYGFLAAAYRHFGDNMKIGVGYNFGHFSDDLRDLTYDDQGIFLNAIGKF